MKKTLLPLILVLVLIFSINCFATPWDVSTATYADKAKDVSAKEIYPRDVTFNPDGTKMYIMGYTADEVYQYTLSTAWDVSTATYADKSVSIVAQESAPRSVIFSSDGTKMYIVGSSSDTVYQYTLSTAWDVSTATYADKAKDVSEQETYPCSVTFNPDGTKMYIVGAITDTVYQYTLSTAWDVSTATYADKYKDVSEQETSPYGVTFNPDGTKMYIVGTTSATVYQYTLPSGITWNNITITKWNGITITIPLNTQ